ncbi:hypothetical protein [Oenococcus oeni]|nr:hypothetical protein [Oenococcus oeni]SYW19498.1 hypothetical protein OENI_160046 [Oenococcus oeni]
MSKQDVNITIKIKNLNELKNLTNSLKTIISQIQNWKPKVKNE